MEPNELENAIREALSALDATADAKIDALRAVANDLESVLNEAGDDDTVG